MHPTDQIAAIFTIRRQTLTLTKGHDVILPCNFPVLGWIA